MRSRVAQLEQQRDHDQAEIAAFEQRDARRESEYRGLLASYSALAAGREELRSEGETATLKADFIDERIEQLRAAARGVNAEIARGQY